MEISKFCNDLINVIELSQAKGIELNGMEFTSIVSSLSHMHGQSSNDLSGVFETIMKMYGDKFNTKEEDTSEEKPIEESENVTP